MTEVAGILLIQGDEYVLQHRDDIPTIAEPGTYSLWGGSLEDGETPTVGALRELKEETGIAIGENELQHLYSFEIMGRGPDTFGKPVKGHLFVVKLGDDIIVNVFEGQGIVRLPKYSEPHDNLNQFAREAIKIYETAAR